MASGSLADLNPSAAGGEGGMEGDLDIGSNLGECDMANNLLADHGDERQSERFGFAQGVDDSRFDSVAERKTGKRPRGQRANGDVVGVRFWANENSYARPVAQGPLNSAPPSGADP